MYEERRNSFSIRDIILQILLVVLFVLIMVWLFPTKNYLKDNYVDTEIYSDYITDMRDAALSYYTTDRVPSKVGETTKLTLAEMLEQKMVLQISGQATCDNEKSYVEVTKMDENYQLKVQLTCDEFTDYILVTIGCTDFCTVCEEVEETTTVTKPTTKPTSTKDYKYQYKLTTKDTYSDWSAWSQWSTTKVTANTLTQVETEQRKEISGYTGKQAIVGYKTETYTDYETKTYTEYVTQTYTDYETKTKQVADGTTTKLVASVNPTTTAGYYTSWVSAGTKTTKDQVLYSTDTVKYTLESTNRYLDCENKCRYVTERHYTVQTRKYVAGTTTCPSGYKLENGKCNKYQTVTKYKTVTEKVAVTKTKQVPVTKTKQVAVTKTRQVPVYGTVKGDPIYKTVTYYRFRTRTQLTVASVKYEWSKSKNDTTLTNKGYVYTGQYEEV